MSRLNGKTAIITGGGSGIGQATALLFAVQGANVSIFDIDSEAATETRDLSKSALDIQIVDLTQPEKVAQAVNHVIDAFNHIDILVNIAGGSGRRWGDGPAHSCTVEGWQKTLDINLNSMFYTTKYVLEHMLAQQSGNIVTVSSVLGLVGGDEDFGTHAYAASKGAAISFTRSLAAYYAPQNIRANVICPGLIATPMSKRAQEDVHIQSRLHTLQPLTSDFGSPADIADAALFLASDEAKFITGSVLTVDGGWTVR